MTKRQQNGPCKALYFGKLIGNHFKIKRQKNRERQAAHGQESTSGIDAYISNPTFLLRKQRITLRYFWRKTSFSKRNDSVICQLWARTAFRTLNFPCHCPVLVGVLSNSFLQGPKLGAQDVLGKTFTAQCAYHCLKTSFAQSLQS